jgi:hypothetical protein
VQHALNESVSLFYYDEDEDTVLSFISAPTTPYSVINSEPNSYSEAIESEEARDWETSMKEEYDSLMKLNVWTLMNLPKGAKAIKGRWVYKNKLGELNQLIRRKSRFVVKGYSQVYGRDYFETHSPVANMKSIKLVLSLTASRDFELYQIDFDTAFLNADVDADIYVEQPEGFHQGGPNVVGKLNKALYGLKQAPRQWNKTIHQFMLKLGYRPLKSDPCVYKKLSKTGRHILICLYVDDTIISVHRDDLAEWEADKEKISSTYAIKDLGECQWILNMKVTRDRNKHTITLSQQAYIERMIKQYGLENTRSVSTPAAPVDLTLPADNSDALRLSSEQKEKYQSIVGSLLYAANITRLDIAFIVNRLCRYTADPCHHHLHAAKRVLRYLGDTNDHCMIFGANPTQHSEPTLTAYSDSDWGGCKETGKSTSGIIVQFNGDTISWISRRQGPVAQSSTEAEYIALAETTKELLWYRNWIYEVLETWTPGLIYGDNQGSVTLAGNADIMNARTKHIGLRYHLIKDEIGKETIKLEWVQSENQLADILTKPLVVAVFNRIRNELMHIPFDKHWHNTLLSMGEC